MDQSAASPHLWTSNAHAYIRGPAVTLNVPNEHLRYLYVALKNKTEVVKTHMFCSYASDVTSGLSDGTDGQSEKSSQDIAKRAAAKQFRRRARARLRITGVSRCANI